MNKKWLFITLGFGFGQLLILPAFLVLQSEAAMPELAGAMNTSGANVTATFYGGASTDDGLTFKEVFTYDEAVDIFARVDVESGHIGLQGSLYIVAVLNSDTFYAKNTNEVWLSWDMSFSSLSAAVENLQFGESEFITVISGLSGVTLGIGNTVVDAYIGYSIINEPNEIYFHSQAIHFSISEAISSEYTVTELDDGSFLCLPVGDPPFSGVLYNHGGLGTSVGGDLEGTCSALAEAGYIAHAKKRRETIPLTGHLDDVSDGLGLLLEQEDIDSESLAVIGFSRGGLLSLQLAVQESNLDVVILMAPASGNGALDQTLNNVNNINAPVLMMVAENDLYQDDHISLAESVVDSLVNANKEVQYIVYPPFGDDGHELFFEVDNKVGNSGGEGYWDDVIEFLNDKL